MTSADHTLSQQNRPDDLSTRSRWNLLAKLGIAIPIIQAPMAGISTPLLAASVANAGALGSISIGATDVIAARNLISKVRELTTSPFNVNVFAHASPLRDAAREAAWLQALRPLFRSVLAEPPDDLRVPYNAFGEDDAVFQMLVETAPPVVSFHFGLPSPDQVSSLKRVGCVLLATATNLSEALKIRERGIDAIVAQGWEAGGHRGVFDPEAIDDQLGTIALTRLLVERSGLPVIAAGGIMDGRGIRAALDLGASAVQMGTAFIACPESAADEVFRAALTSDAAHHTVMTRLISGRPARGLPNRFTSWEAGTKLDIPAYPIAYDAGKALHAAAKAVGEFGYAAHWAGQGAPFARSLPAADLVATLYAEARIP